MVDITASSTDLESALLEIWAEILNVPAVDIGPRDSFFDLSGDSFTAMVLCNTIHERLGHPLSFSQLVYHPTIAELATHLAEAAA